MKHALRATAILMLILGRSAIASTQSTDDLIADQIQIEQANEDLTRIQEAREKIQTAISIGRFIQRLDSLAWIEFPVVLADTVGNVPVAIVFDHLRLYPEYAQLEVIVGMELPQQTVTSFVDQNVSLNEGTGQTGTNAGGTIGSDSREYVELYFGTPNLKFSHDGGIIGDATLGLYSDVPIGTMNPEKFAMILRGWHEYSGNQTGIDLGTYVKIDCDGFVEMGVEADILFSRDWMLPLNAQGDTMVAGTGTTAIGLYGNRVGGHIQTIVSDWNNILVEVSLPDFALTSYPDIGFNLTAAVFDFSDYRNSPNVVFPQAYLDNGYLPPGNVNLWRGVYIRNLEVMLPKQFDRVASNQTAPGGTSTPANGGQSQGGALILDDFGEHHYTSSGLQLPDFHSFPASIPEGEATAGPSPPAAPPPSASTAQPIGPAPARATNETSTESGEAIGYQKEVSVQDVASSGEGDPSTILTGVAGWKGIPVAPLPPNNRTRIGVEHLLIDGLGVSGHFYATNVLNIDDGRMDGRWRFSITSLELELLTSQVVGFGFGGQVAVPIAKKGQSFDYDAFVNIPDREYNFTVSPAQNMTFPVFQMAEIQIHESSYLNIVSTPNSFVPTAVLYGYAEVRAKTAPQEDTPPPENGNSGGDNEQSNKLSFTAAKLNFHGLILSTQAPRVDIEVGGYLSLENELKLLGFPIPVAEPTLTMTPAGRLKLGFNVDLNLMDQSDHGFAVGTDVDILGAMDSTVTYDQWKSAGMNISSIYVNIQLPSLSIIGYAHVFDDDPTFGNGFQGALDIEIGPEEKRLVEVEMNAIFGHTSFKYWYVDALVELPVGVPIIPEVLMINGIGGGAYYHMSMVSANLIGGSDGSAGTTTSGVKYEPDENVVLGLKASLPFASMSSETIDGVVTLELVFSGTGLQEIMFYGKCEIVAPIEMPSALGKMSEKFAERIEKLPLPKEVVDGIDEQETSSPNNAILASVFLRLNFEAGFEFQGTFRCEFSFANNTVSGGGAIDVLASDPQDKWHIYIGGYSGGSIIGNDGLPLHPIYVSIALSQNVTGTAQAYFLVGNDIPGPPPPPANSGPCINFPSNGPAQNRGPLDAGRAAAGTGFAFGAAVEIGLKFRTRRYRCRTLNTRDRCCYTCSRWHNNKAEITLGAGFDVSLLKYASGTYCSQTGDSPHGHKGWRATGRIWAFIDASVRYRGAGMNVGLGCAIDADIPDPSYLYATAYVKVVFCFNATAEFGDRCGTVYN
ncbi:hypothetical protein [Lewinella sp. W8]|uniref:hypothetical protein n=1 Tax=Lewinella sp. W8 TaxID=2528208 RepID=UPI001067C861|nr:hypothetical protein [Lewinella sp. W8]MTB52346.1 hypothetical protein [Lewinella sp. W8]